MMMNISTTTVAIATQSPESIVSTVFILDLTVYICFCSHWTLLTVLETALKAGLVKSEIIP